MKLYRLFYATCIAVSALFTSCDTENVDIIYQGDTMGVTFATASQSVSFPSTGYEGFEVEVIRAKYTEAASVPVSAKLINANGELVDVPSTISVPATVDFAAGENISSVYVSVGDITPGENYRLALSIDDSMAPVDAIMTKTITIFRDYTYSVIGIGEVQSSFGGMAWEAEVQKADQISWYKIVDMYDTGYDVVLKVAADGKTVTVDQQAITSDISGYGTGYVAGSGMLENGVIEVDLEFTVSAGSFGVYTEKVVLPVNE